MSMKSLHYDPLHQEQLTKHPGKVKDESTCRESLSQEQESDLYDVPKKTGRDDTYDYAQVPTPELQQRSKQKKKRRSKFKKRDSHLSVHSILTDEVQGQNEYVNIPIDRPPLPIPQQTKQQEGSKDKSNAVLTPPVTPQPKPRHHQNPTLQGRSLNDDEPKANSTSREEPTVAQSLDDTSLDYDYARFSALEIQRQPKDTKKPPSELTLCAHDPIETSQIENGTYVSLTDKSLLVYDTPREFFSTLLKKSSNT